MKRMKLAAGTFAVLLIGAAAGYWFADSRGLESGENESSTGQSDRKVLYWHDPMVPGAKFDKPGKSPFMDMQLVPVYADEEDGATVRVNPAVAQNLGIRLAKVEKSVLRPRLSAVGSVAFDEESLEVVQARVEGYITRLRVRAPLEQVHQGQALAEVVSPDWLAAQQEYLALLDAQSERGRAVREAARQRLVVLGVPEATIKDVEAHRQVNAATTIVAPIDGVVTELAVREGAAFMPGAPLFRINGLRTVWVNAQIPEAQVSMAQLGASVDVRTSAWPARTFRGQVRAILPNVDPQTRTLPMRVVIDNTDLELAPGMFVSLDLTKEAGEPALVVPSEAVIMTGERSVVVVAREGGGFDVADVRVGMEADGKTAILAGLEEGQSVVVSGQFLIDSEASLKAAVTRLASEPAPASDTEPQP